TVLQQNPKVTTFEPHPHAPGARMSLEASRRFNIQTLPCAGYDHHWGRGSAYPDDAAPRLPKQPIQHRTVQLDHHSAFNTSAHPLTYSRGQNVSPAYEGWERNADGSFSFLFGYMNRNWEEEIDVPVGPDNDIEPGGPDQGQPTHYLPRRNPFIFKVRVPKDFG